VSCMDGPGLGNLTTTGIQRSLESLTRRNLEHLNLGCLVAAGGRLCARLCCCRRPCIVLVWVGLVCLAVIILLLLN
jgi:hypothetical protein